MSSETENRVDDLISCGLEKFGFGDLDGALEDWRSALQLDPFNETAAEYITLATDQLNKSKPETEAKDEGQSIEDVSNAADELGDLVDELSFGEKEGFGAIELAEASPTVVENVINNDPKTGEQESGEGVFSTQFGMGRVQESLESESAQELQVEITNVGIGVELDFGEEESPYEELSAEGLDTEGRVFLEEWIDASQPTGANEYDRIMKVLKEASVTCGDDFLSFATKSCDFSKRAASKGDFRWAVCSDAFIEEMTSDDGGENETIRNELLPIQKKFLGDSSRFLEKTANDVSLDPKSAFLLSRIDGMLSADDLIDVSGMPKNETLTILLRLILRDVVKSV